MRILVLRFSSLGDVTLASAPILALASLHPEAEIALATKKGYAPLFDSFPSRLTIVPYESTQSISDYVASLGDPSFDLIVDLHGSLRSRAITRRLKGVVVKRVRKWPLRRWRMVWSKNGLDQPLSIVRSYLEAIDAPEGSHRPRLFLSAAEQTRVRELKQGCPITIGIGWGAKHPTKSVPLSTWRELISALQKSGPISLLVFGMERDKTEIDTFARNEVSGRVGITMESFISLPLREVMIRLASCDAFVSSDSGLMHVADALDVPTFGLFGPTHPALGFAPAGEKSQAFHAGTWCSPCHRHGSAPCFRERRFCFDELNVERIAAAIAATLKVTGRQ